jgi:hypothetical protein
MQGTHYKTPAIGGSIRNKIVNPDLAEERAKQTFDPTELENLICIPGMRSYYLDLVSDAEKYPNELQAPP